MRATRRHRWLCAVLLAPLAVLAVSASSFSALRCTMSGVLVPETCCSTVAGAPIDETPGQPALKQQDCCERIVVSNAKTPAVSADSAEALPAGPVAVVTPGVPEVSTASAKWTRRGAMLRPLGPSAPAFLLTHAFLI